MSVDAATENLRAAHMRQLGEIPLGSMSSVVLQLRRYGYDELANALIAVRDDWARTVSAHAEGRPVP